MLSSRWYFGSVPPIPLGHAEANDISQVTEWLSASVPGNLRADLLAHHRVPDPHIGAQYLQSEWVDGCDWWYRTELSSTITAGQRVFLRFYGLDYLSAIFINGVEMVRHEGMFSRVTLEITEQLLSGDCNIAVRFWGNHALPQRDLSRKQQLWSRIAHRLQNSWTGVYPPRSATLKSQMGFGWDFAPSVRTIGIWDKVEYYVAGKTFIEDAHITLSAKGEGKVRLKLNTINTEDIITKLTIKNTRNTTHFAITADEVAAQHGIINRRFTLPEPQLWQPWDRGTPYLYTAQIEIDHSDSVEAHFGARSVSLEDWQFRINGQNEFMRGFNWVPADILPGTVAPADYAIFLQMAKDSGANMLRVWGGGLREKSTFYDLCDELGLMVWQEFPFACMFLGTYPCDTDFLNLVAQEVGEIVSQLDAHPSVVAWCGGNEFSPRRNRPLIKVMKHAIRENSLDNRPFLPASPSANDAHHWDVWHGKAPLSAYRHENAKFLSEFGLQALPHLNTLKKILPAPKKLWENALGDTEKLHRYLDLFITGTHTRNKNIEILIEASQRAQKVGLQTAIEHMRRRKRQTGGVIAWQFNEPAPAISWAIIDYFRRPKLAYRQMKNSFNPVMVSLDFEVGKNWQVGSIFFAEIWIVNDTLDAVTGNCRVWLDDEIVFDEMVSSPMDSAVKVANFSRQLVHKPHQLRIELKESDAIIAENIYPLDWHDAAKRDWWLWLRRRLAEWVLR